MRKLSLLLLLAVVATACGSTDRVVASVDGREIHQSDVAGLRSRQADFVPGAEFRSDLARLIVAEVVQTSLDEQFGVQITGADVEAELEVQLANAGLTEEELLGRLDEPDATPEWLRSRIVQILLQQRAQEALASRPEFLDRLLAEQPDALVGACVEHVLVATQAEAQAVFNRLLGGEVLADVANSVSLDSAPGGDLGCRAASAYVGPFADAVLVAPINEPFGPVETEFGWHVLLVTARSAPTEEEVRADPGRFVPAEVVQLEWSEWANEQVQNADIDVASYVGTWLPEGLGIAPPD